MSYVTARSYGGVKGRAPHYGTGKRYLAAQAAVKAASAAARAAMRAQNAAVSGAMGPIARQSMRTGGWSNPTRSGELKFADTSGAGTLNFGSLVFAAPGPTTLLNGLVPDSTATGRIGRKIVMKSLYLRWQASIGATSTGGSPVRIIVVYDKQANTQAPATSDILLQDAFLSPNNLSNRDRFVVLCDELTEPLATGNNFSIAGTVYKKLNLETMYNQGNAGTIGDITSGSVYILWAHAGTIGTANGQFNWRCRIRYSDN